MKVAIVKESAPNERRVALVPEAIGRLTGAGHEILIQTGEFAAAREIYGFPFTQPFPDVDRTECLIIVGANPVIDGSSTTGTITWTFNSGAENFDHVAAGQLVWIGLEL